MPLPQLQNLKITPPQPATMRLQAMGMQQRNRQLDISEQYAGLQREQFEFNKMKANLEIGERHLPSLRKDEYGKYIDWLEGIGAPVEFLPSKEEVNKMSDSSFEDLKNRIMLGSEGIRSLSLEQFKAKIAEGKEKTEQANRIALETEKQKNRIALEKVKSADGKNLTEMQLTQRALAGDKEAKSILDSMTQRKIEIGKAAAQGKIEGLYENIDIEGTAESVLQGRETIENIKNTFGVPIQEAVRKAVLAKDSEFNFLLPRAVVRSLDTSLKGQEKQRGLMGSFVRNIEKQISRVDEIEKEISRWGIRAFDLPKRELITRVKGSGKEKTLEAYLTEISAEIGKLSTGSSASIRELSTEAQARWNRIHDPNLSLKELKIILDETRHMAEMRISSTNEEIEFTKERLKNLKTGGSSTLQRSVPQQTAPSKFEILSVE